MIVADRASTGPFAVGRYQKLAGEKKRGAAALGLELLPTPLLPLSAVGARGGV
jgi:hypothetical protein